MRDLKQTLERDGGRRERDRDQRVRVVAAIPLIVDPSLGSSPDQSGPGSPGGPGGPPPA